jgi:hypothetical protein
MKKKNRYIVYADFLGTEQRYSTPKLIVRGRELLEQALNMLVIPRMRADDMYLYVFSDTAILTCPSLSPLLEPISALFNHWVDLQGDSGITPLSLWLRAGISYGEVLYVDHLQNSDRIRTIPFLDTSLPKAYKLETIRKGSRVFIDPAIPDDAFVGSKDVFFRWQQITGHGYAAYNVTEYLWPAKSQHDTEHLARMTLKLHGWWSKELDKKEWSRDEYYESLIHLDETVKLLIRTSSAFCAGDSKRDLLFSLLPKTKSPHKNVRFEWGMWFQVLKGLVESETRCPADTHDVETAFDIVKWILAKGGFFSHFIGELKYSDYSGFGRRLKDLGLHQFE